MLDAQKHLSLFPCLMIMRAQPQSMICFQIIIISDLCVEVLLEHQNAEDFRAVSFSRMSGRMALDAIFKQKCKQEIDKELYVLLANQQDRYLENPCLLNLRSLIEHFPQILLIMHGCPKDCTTPCTKIAEQDLQTLGI